MPPSEGPADVQHARRGVEVPAFISFLAAGAALYPANPSNMTLPSRDSGVFLYMGWRLLSGDLPYRDVWDHKPPLIYFVDALGLLLTPDSLWGVWLLQFVFAFFTFFFLYKTLDSRFGAASALAGVVVLASGFLTVIEQGNVTEEYALVFQALCFWLVVRGQREDYAFRTSLWIGLCAGIAFNFKQTTVGTGLAYALVLLGTRLLQKRSPLGDLTALGIGWLIPSAAIVSYAASQNILSDYWQQAFLYNFVYIGKHEGLRRLIPVFFKGFTLLGRGGVWYLAVAGWLSGLISAWMRRRAQPDPLILLALVSLPAEILLIMVSGRSIIHYYLTPLPVMAILAGILVFTAPRLVEWAARHPMGSSLRSSSAVLLLAVLLLQTGQVRAYPEYVRSTALNEHAAVIDYVTRNTEPDDRVLIIGAESAINFLTRREAPTRYVYQYPLALLGRRPMFEEYFNQILANKPILIIDTRGRERLDEKLYEPLQKRSEIVREGVRYLGENYGRVAQFGEWSVYRLAER